MMSFKYGVRDVRNLPGSDDAVCDKILLASAQSETDIIESGFNPEIRNPSHKLPITQFFQNCTNFFRQRNVNRARILHFKH